MNRNQFKIIDSKKIGRAEQRNVSKQMINRMEMFKKCKKCKFRQGVNVKCWFGDIEGSQEEKIPLPECQGTYHTPPKNTKNKRRKVEQNTASMRSENTDSGRIKVERKGQKTGNKHKQETSQHTRNHTPFKNTVIKRREVERSLNIAKSTPLDETKAYTGISYDLNDKRLKKVLYEIISGQHINAIHRVTGISIGTVENIVSFLVYRNIIHISTKILKNNNNRWCKVYKLTEPAQNIERGNIYNDKPATDAVSVKGYKSIKVTHHCGSYGGKIKQVPEFEPEPTRFFYPKGWVGRVYENESEHGTVRRLKYQLIFDFSKKFMHTLPAGDDLQIKAQIKTLAESELRKFAQKWNYKVGAIEQVRGTTEIPVAEKIKPLLTDNHRLTQIQLQ